MCLWQVTKIYKRPKYGEQVAWKILEEWEGFRTPWQGWEVTTEWDRAQTYNLESVYREGDYKSVFYPSGFHCFKTKEIAENAYNWLARGRRAIHPVMIKGIVCYGPDGAANDYEYYDADLTTLVARWMRLLTDEERQRFGV